MSENMVFCFGDLSSGIGYQSNNCVFNVEVSNEAFAAIKDRVLKIFDGIKLRLNDFKKVPQEKWVALSKVPHFNRDIVEKIVGFELDLNPNVRIEVDGKVVYISKESAIALNLI